MSRSWATRDPDASSGSVVAEIIVALCRARFRDMTGAGVDMTAGGAGYKDHCTRMMEGGER